MLFLDINITIMVWCVMVLVAMLTSHQLAQSDTPIDLLATRDLFGLAKLIGLIFVQIIALLILLLNWCNAAAVTLVSYILVFLDAFIEEKTNSDHLQSILCIFFLAVIAAILTSAVTQFYMSASKYVESHKITSYQIKSAYSYGKYHELRRDYTIMYFCEDPSYSGELNLNDEKGPAVRFCVDVENPRIEEVTYVQDFIEYVITGGTVKLGTKTLREVVFYLPDTNFLAPPPELPDE